MNIRMDASRNMILSFYFAFSSCKSNGTKHLVENVKAEAHNGSGMRAKHYTATQ